MTEGTTRTERYLTALCRRTFLRLWSWPNLYRDQKGGARTEGKELSDLLVVFGDHLVIFSDKECAFPDSGDIQKDWSRWFKRSVWKSAEQIWGAERWLRSYPDRIFLNSSCTNPLPISIPGPSCARFHRVVVAHGAGPRCKAIGGSGSLSIFPSVTGKSHFEPNADVTPFAIGNLSEDNRFVHVIDDSSLEILLSTLDTISDFVNYLEQKENLIASGKLALAASEQDLLAVYLEDVTDSGLHSFNIPAKADAMIVNDGVWAGFSVHPDRLAQLDANQISYEWDALIDKFTRHMLDGTQYFDSTATVAELEIALRFMAAEDRTHRRMLATAFIRLLERGAPGEFVARVVRPFRSGDPHYIFVVYGPEDDTPLHEYRLRRLRILQNYCTVARQKWPSALHIIGIATEHAGWSRSRTEDLVYLDGRDWSDELEQQAIMLQQQIPLLSNLRERKFTANEYPRKSNATIKKGRNRNKACPCGSGLKYKRCCGNYGER